MSDGSSKLIAIDADAKHSIVPDRRFSKANGVTHETLDASPCLDR
jgi:hypothetical protein